MVTVFFGPNQLILVQATQDRYGAAVLGSVPVGAYRYQLVPLVYRRMPFAAGFAEISHKLLYYLTRQISKFLGI